MTIDKNDWELSSYLYDLPQELIATRPAQKRDGSRLLVFHETTGKVEHRLFRDLESILPSEAHLVLNSSKVYPCRLIGQKQTGGKCEIFLLSLGESKSGKYHYHCLIKARGNKKIGQIFKFDDDMLAEISEIHSDGTFSTTFNVDYNFLMNYLDQKALIPLPPYIRGGESDERDRSDYQTVYAKELGSVAAPTAGLHFTKEILSRIPHSYVNLHVSLGTFKPVNTDDIREHDIHSEDYSIEKRELDQINNKADNIFAVGTTSLRVLESCHSSDGFKANEESQSTQIFLYPGKKVESVRGLITNFHLPGSSLIMLVSAMIGREKTLELYNIAIKEKYRFYSYGDAMMIIRK